MFFHKFFQIFMINVYLNYLCFSFSEDQEGFSDAPDKRGRKSLSLVCLRVQPRPVSGGREEIIFKDVTTECGLLPTVNGTGTPDLIWGQKAKRRVIIFPKIKRKMIWKRTLTSNKESKRKWSTEDSGSGVNRKRKSNVKEVMCQAKTKKKVNVAEETGEEKKKKKTRKI